MIDIFFCPETQFFYVCVAFLAGHLVFFLMKAVVFLAVYSLTWVKLEELDWLWLVLLSVSTPSANPLLLC